MVLFKFKRSRLPNLELRSAPQLGYFQVLCDQLMSEAVVSAIGTTYHLLLGYHPGHSNCNELKLENEIRFAQAIRLRPYSSHMLLALIIVNC